MIIRKAIVSNFNDALKLVKNTGSAAVVHGLLAKNGVLNTIVIEKIDNRAANILKQEVISVGAAAAISENVSRFKKGVSDTVLFATINQTEKLINKLRLQPFGLKEIASKLDNTVSKKKVFKYGEEILDLSNPVVMGIVNMDPNSFSGDGLTDSDKALKQAIEFERFGARVIDMGAESSRPGVNLVDARTEIRRLLPALKKIRKSVKIPISVDTYKYETAKAALDEGADIVNDIFALRRGKERLAKLIADTKAGVILMHMKGIPKNMQMSPEYKNCTSEVYEFLAQRKEYAVGFGIKEERIAVDPGPGFGKTVKHNVELIKNIDVFSTLGAVVGAVSRKRFVKALAGEDKISFIAANFLAAFCGADIIRVHDVKETVNVLKIVEAFRRA
ncbi:dihydropteroate synthase [Candidatus Endomicrobiellum agilis]|uniref:dihydropteroate synthase n=1 Tax=Candidatus Endomicrobiellum agilis TaxID=3238957 RepID=UPI0035800BBC|nr:dihydropteroate synthase [Endomicrobium sp.]